MFSKACEYGIRAATFLASCSETGERKNLKQIAEACDAPEAFTAKILQILSKEELISSIKGAFGGYEISTDKLTEIKLSHIVKAIDGDNIYKGCGLGLAQCNEKKPCPLHFQFKSIRDELKIMLESTSLWELAHELKDGTALLKR
ncbi:MAG: Rrf2 family transcriptional regulator [Saprospiraceae bacterium]|nr:Rrf2 family transcriptional regulator [Saprospiraceae bacterium]